MKLPLHPLILFTLLSTGGFSSFAAVATLPSTATPENRLTVEWWGPRHEEKLAQAKAGGVDLVMIGDSITHYWEKQRHYADFFGPLNTLNLGFGGDRTQNALWRLQHGEVDGISPKLVTMMIGTNNTKRDKPEDIVSGIQAIVAELRERLPESKIVVFSVFPRKPSTENDRVLAVNRVLPRIADGKQVVHVDISDQFLDENGVQRAELYGRDLLHLSNQGYETWQRALTPILAEAGLQATPAAQAAAPVKKESGPAVSADDAPVIRLWPIERVGGEKNRLKEEFRDRRGQPQLSAIKDPNLTVYLADSTKLTPAVVYCPGGAYKVLGPQPELIEWLNAQGISVFMLKYTIPDNRDAAFQDIQRAMRLVRHQAGRWNVDPGNIGVVGQSAGGHLSARLSQNYTESAYEPIDEADRKSCEPNFAILVSAAYLAGPSRETGLAPEFHLQNPVAPTFLVIAKDDTKFIQGAVHYEKALQEKGAPIQMQLYDQGGHGLRGIDWFPVAEAWLHSLHPLQPDNAAAGSLRAAGIFTDGMILQQGMAAPVWGKAAPGTEVTIVFGNQEKKTVADADGNWMVKLAPLTASATGAVMTIHSGADTVSIKDVLVGEVWLCAGQSNMDWTLRKLTRGPGGPDERLLHDYLLNEVATAKDPLLRQFTVGAAASPLEAIDEIQTKSGWTQAVKGEVDDFSGTGYFFGRELRKNLGVPVGLIDSNRGGTDIEPWIPKHEYLKTAAGKAFYAQETAKRAPEAAKKHKAAYQKQLVVWKQQAAAAKAAGQRAPRKPADPLNPNRVPAALYNAFIHPLAPYAMKGTIWYQGENNTAYRTEQYRDSMLKLVNGWRDHWGQAPSPGSGALREPFYFFWCQLAKFKNSNEEPNDGDAWVQIQNQQREVLALTSDTGMAVLNDFGSARNLHPKNKVDVGRRLSLLAMNKAYGKNNVCSGPLYKSSRVEGQRVVLTFDHAGSGLMTGKKEGVELAQAVDEPLRRFQICGADRQWQWAAAKITGRDTVEVWHPDIEAPVEVRYAWSSNPEGANLYNREGLPASLFKTSPSAQP